MQTDALKLRVWGALLAMLAVALGAFGAHGFAAVLQANQTTAIYQTASDYHFYHAIGLLVVAGLSTTPIGPSKKLRLIGRLLISGTVIFSGTLYLLALTNWRWLGAVTPVGGILLLLGWLLLVVDGIAALRRYKSASKY